MQDPSMLRVEKGRPSPEELAAVTAVLLARGTPPSTPPAARRPAGPRATWSRPDRAPGFQGPRTWRTDT